MPFFSSQIIAILAAILFPVFARAREKARQTSCLSNVKQLILGIRMYAQDYDDCLIMATLRGYTSVTGAYMGTPGTWLYWMDLVMPYVKNKQLFHCPSRPGAWVGYGYNCYLGAAGTWLPSNLQRQSGALSLAQIDYPSATVLITDYQTVGTYGSCWYRIQEYFANDPDYDVTVHNGGWNIGFVDGHAKWRKPSESRGRALGGDLYWYCDG